MEFLPACQPAAGARMSAPTDTPLRRWRQRMGLSQRAAAEALGLALTSYQDQERGTNRRTGEPIRTPRTLLLACAALEAGLAPIE